jgi:hypothetical protein
MPSGARLFDLLVTPQQHRARVHLHAEQGIRFVPQVLTLVELGLAVELVDREIQVAIGRQRQGVGPQQARVVDNGLVAAVCSPPSVALKVRWTLPNADRDRHGEGFLDRLADVDVQSAL